MLKRAWLVLSVGWALLLLVALDFKPANGDMPLIVLPLFAGPVLWFAGRFIFTGLR
jgi:hypothetical protein